MKARIKKTGELVELASYAKITLDKCDSWGNPIELSPEEVELVNEEEKQPTDIANANDYWQKVRERASMYAMQSIIPTQKSAYMICDAHKRYDDCAREAVRYADALVERLKDNYN